MVDTERDTMLLEIRDTVVELKTVVLGTNGFKGLLGDVDDVRADVNVLKDVIPTLQTKNGCAMVHFAIDKKEAEEAEATKAVAKAKERRKMSLREVLLILATLVGAGGWIVSLFHH